MLDQLNPRLMNSDGGSEFRVFERHNFVNYQLQNKNYQSLADVYFKCPNKQTFRLIDIIDVSTNS